MESVTTVVSPAFLITSRAMRASCPHEMVSAITKSMPAWLAHPTCSSNMARDGSVDVGVAGHEDVRVAHVAGEQRSGLRRNVLGDLESLDVHRLEVGLATDEAQLLAVCVVREGLDHVGAGVDELPMELSHQLGMLQDHDRNVGAGLQVAPALELEQVPLGADHRPLREPLEKAPVGAGVVGVRELLQASTPRSV